MKYCWSLTLCIASLAFVNAQQSTCRCFPTDVCWPSEQTWSAFNHTVNGRLIKNVPLGSPCHEPFYDEAICNELASEWMSPLVHINSSSSVQDPIFANASCDPFTPSSSPCRFGNYVRYTVNVSEPTDIAATIRFAEKHNIRLVIRNTAHDYVGRSTGAGAIAIWTHFLKDTQIVDWSDASYVGKALKMGAGIQGSELLDAISASGLVAVTGECPTVGIAGGYLQSGGHSPLATAFGLGADQTLQFEVVTANGQLVTASPSQNADLFWALSGSGAGNYGVVYSVTYKIHPDANTSGVSIVIDTPGVDYATVLNKWHSFLPDIIDAGTMATYYALNTTFVLHPLTGYNLTIADLSAALSPFIESLAADDIHIQPNYTSFATYNEHYVYYFGPLPAGLFGVAGGDLIGGRFLTRDTLPNVGSAINSSTLSIGGMFIGQSMNVSRFESPTRAVLPQWRQAVVSSSYSLPYDFHVPFVDMLREQGRITNKIMPVIEALTPNAGAYINEGNYEQKDWQDVFYGSNYERLAQVKSTWDPKDLFWNAIAVGSEGWAVSEGGRLCKVA